MKYWSRSHTFSSQCNDFRLRSVFFQYSHLTSEKIVLDYSWFIISNMKEMIKRTDLFYFYMQLNWLEWSRCRLGLALSGLSLRALVSLCSDLINKAVYFQKNSARNTVYHIVSLLKRKLKRWCRDKKIDVNNTPYSNIYLKLKRRRASTT